MLSTVAISRRMISYKNLKQDREEDIFNRLNVEKSLIVLKNDELAGVILSPSEYDRMVELEEDNMLLADALERLQNNVGKANISFDEVLSKNGITQDDLDFAEDVEIG